jgi:hypothetical protein
MLYRYKKDILKLGNNSCSYCTSRKLIYVLSCKNILNQCSFKTQVKYLLRPTLQWYIRLCNEQSV